jgi:hypothetical protein
MVLFSTTTNFLLGDVTLSVGTIFQNRDEEMFAYLAECPQQHKKCILNIVADDAGKFRTLYLGELTEGSIDKHVGKEGSGTFNLVEGSVADLICSPENNGAVFQVASNFNGLETTSARDWPNLIKNYVYKNSGPF